MSLLRRAAMETFGRVRGIRSVCAMLTVRGRARTTLRSATEVEALRRKLPRSSTGDNDPAGGAIDRGLQPCALGMRNASPDAATKPDTAPTPVAKGVIGAGMYRGQPAIGTTCAPPRPPGDTAQQHRPSPRQALGTTPRARSPPRTSDPILSAAPPRAAPCDHMMAPHRSNRVPGRADACRHRISGQRSGHHEVHRCDDQPWNPPSSPRSAATEPPRRARRGALGATPSGSVLATHMTTRWLRLSSASTKAN